jgi:DNA-binding response OmpR family regulator
MTRVLVIEDDTWQAEMMAGQLVRGGYVVDTAYDALAAFAIIDQQTPDIIVLDMMLPGPNGMTFLHELHSHADIAAIPVIVCTTKEINVATLQPYGVVAVLDKATMQPDDVVFAVRKVLS